MLVTATKLFRDLLPLGSEMYAGPEEVIFAEGEAPGGAYLLLSGRVGLSMATRDRGLVLANVVGRGTILGIASTVATSLHMFTAVALEPTVMSYIPSEQLKNLLRDHATLGVDIVVALSVEAAAMRRRWSELLRRRGTSGS